MPSRRAQPALVPAAALPPANASLPDELIYKRTCFCTQRAERRRAALASQLPRAIVFDSSPVRHWNGLGNSLPRWLNLLRLGLAIDRATFLQFAAGTFDPGRYFATSEGVRWDYDDVARQRLREAMRAQHGLDEPAVLRYTCLAATHTCIKPQLCDGGGSCTEWSHEEEEAGAVLRWLRDHPSPWLHVIFDLQEAFEPSARLAAVTHIEADHCPDATAMVDREPARGRAIGVKGAGQLSLRCEANALLRPQPWLLALMQPTLERIRRHRPLVGLHLRSGFADWQALSTWPEWIAAKHLPPLPFASHWQRLDAFLQDCSEPDRAPGAPCFLWSRPHKGQAPTMNDSLACRFAPGQQPPSETARRAAPPGHRRPFLLQGAPSDGTLSAAAQCVGRLATSLADADAAPADEPSTAPAAAYAPSSAASWGVLVLGDTPSLAPLLRMLPQFEGRVLEAEGAGQLGHTAFAASVRQQAELRRGAPADDPGGAWTRSVVDLLLGSLTDGVFSVLFSSFVDEAVLRRSLTAAARHTHWGAMYDRGSTHRDLPMRDPSVLAMLMQRSHVEEVERRDGRRPEVGRGLQA